jgi:tRNA nucleotidyltransferase (CCA-adding enzyme)
MSDKIAQIQKAILEKVTPGKTERTKIETLAKKLEKKVASAAKEFGIKARVRVEGSVAKDTWLSKEPDIDVFMRVPTTIPRKSLGETCLRVARKATEGSEQTERFAEHPYLEAFVEGVRVNIVPCYDTARGEWLSATDRTPYHTDYVQKHLTAGMRDEVRLLKKFMKGTGVYGAEIKIGGFSGYLCELLVLQYGSFARTLQTFAKLKQRLVIDSEKYYERRERELELLFKEPLVIVDPVDKGRNVASAVQPHKLYTLVAASQAFLKTPDENFFYPPETLTPTPKELKERLLRRGSAIVFVMFEGVNAVPDVLWGQLYKSQRSLRRLVQLNDFTVLRDVAWSDEKTVNVFLFELEQTVIPPVKVHLGPPLEKELEGERFLHKHCDGAGTVSGPYVEGGRWVVQIRRKHNDVIALLTERLLDGGKNAGIADQISQIIKKGFRILVNDEITQVYGKNQEFAVFLTEFLSGKPKWLETDQHKRD